MGVDPVLVSTISFSCSPRSAGGAPAGGIMRQGLAGMRCQSLPPPSMSAAIDKQTRSEIYRFLLQFALALIPNWIKSGFYISAVFVDQTRPHFWNRSLSFHLSRSLKIVPWKRIKEHSQLYWNCQDASPASPYGQLRCSPAAHPTLEEGQKGLEKERRRD